MGGRIRKKNGVLGKTYQLLYKTRPDTLIGEVVMIIFIPLMCVINFGYVVWFFIIFPYWLGKNIIQIVTGKVKLLDFFKDTEDNDDDESGDEIQFVVSLVGIVVGGTVLFFSVPISFFCKLIFGGNIVSEELFIYNEVLAYCLNTTIIVFIVLFLIGFVHAIITSKSINTKNKWVE